MIEYAKATPEDIGIRIEAINRGPEPAALHILPHLWFRNTWALGRRPLPRADDRAWGRQGPGFVSLVDRRLGGRGAWPTIPVRYRLGPRTLYAPRGGALLFTDNETNMPARLRARAHPAASPTSRTPSTAT